MHSSTPAENFAAARLLDAGGVLDAVYDAHRRHDVPVALPTTVNAGAYHVDGLAACWGRVPIGTVRPLRDLSLQRGGARAIAAANDSMNITLADKTHVEAWDGDETSQNVPDDERLD